MTKFCLGLLTDFSLCFCDMSLVNEKLRKGTGLIVFFGKVGL